MKPVHATVVADNSQNNIFFIREVVQPRFSSELHFHEECQLAYILQGSGKRIVGDSIDHFKADELVFIGTNIPHVWNVDKRSEAGLSQSVSLSLFISPNKFIEHLSAFGDVQRVKTLLDKANRGMLITGETKAKITKLLKIAATQLGIEQIITFFELINILSTTSEYKPLASPNYINLISHKDNERMDRVYHFLLQNFNKEIRFRQVADLAGMNPQAFCRFFKSRTQKSLTSFVNEIRITYACKLLVENKEPISQIAYSCGFNNVSNFNHFFKLFKKIPPRQFRKELLG